MADVEDFLSQSYSFLCESFREVLIGAAVLLIATVLTKLFVSRGVKRKSRSEDTNIFCSSPGCLRCCHSHDPTTAKILSKKLDEFAHKRNDKTGLERLYKATERYKTLKSKTNLLSSQKPTVFYLDGVASKPWHDCYCKELKSLLSSVNLELIKTELEQIRSPTSEGWFRNKTPEGEWLVYHLFNQGEKVENNCMMCPKTVQIIESVEPLMKGSSFGNALFSIIQPGTHITAHYGPTNCRIRCHLPLLVPDGCRLCVNGQEKKWKEGEVLLFDDSFLHEAWHKGDEGERVVLMLDLWHPELTVIEREALAFMFPPQ